jgi:hypothetical protein
MMNLNLQSAPCSYKFITGGTPSKACNVWIAGHFPVMKSLTILPKTVIPRIMPVTIARRTAKTRVSLKTTKKSGTKITQSIIVRQPVAKSFVSNIRVVLPVFLLRGSLLRIITEAG